jgi:predicted anti-sigma-YlaC factor YlaD
MTDCHLHREHLSADLDGEAGPGGAGLHGAGLHGAGLSATGLDAAQRHLATCPDCGRWWAEATRINRLVRTAPADPGPGFTAEQLDGLLDLLPEPARTGPSLARRLLRITLAVVGVVQVALGVWSLWVPHGGPDAHAAGTGMLHMSHEYSAWSIALGISFLAGAVWTRHLAGALPVLVSFVGVLLVVSTIDLINDTVDLDRVVSHGLIVLGLGLVVAIVMTRPEPDLRPSQGPDRVRQDVDEPDLTAPRPVGAPATRDGTSDTAARHHAA